MFPITACRGSRFVRTKRIGFPQEGLIAGYAMNTEGGVVDLSPQGNHLTAVNSPTLETPGKPYAGSLEFLHVSQQYMTRAAGDLSGFVHDGSEPLSIVAWAKLNSIIGVEQMIASREHLSTGFGWSLFYAHEGSGGAKSWQFRIRDTTNTNRRVHAGPASQYIPQLNEWNFVHAYYDPDAREVACQVGTAEDGLNPINTAGTVNLMRTHTNTPLFLSTHWIYGPERFLNGNIGEVAIFNRLLSSGEVNKIFNEAEGLTIL